MLLRITDNDFSEHVRRAATALRNGGLLIGPTDTLYGVLAPATDEQAYRRIFELKGRMPDQPLPLIAADAQQVADYCRLSATAQRLAERFWPGPLTLVLPARENTPAWCRAQDDTLAVRVPDHGFCRALAAELDAPLTATSANLSGEPPARRLDQVAEVLKAGVEVLVDGGESPKAEPSTILRVLGDSVQILRPGAVSEDDVRTFLGATAFE